ncbi:MAG: hypothetical protein H0T57_15970 [Rubrobacter sp.]|nr:hypothetical protein [Rubrobacter sp.]
MTTKTEEQNLLARVDELDGEIEELELRKEEALAVIRRARGRFEELDEQRKELSPKTFFGDAAASLELEVVEDEHEALNRSVRVAESAAPEFERMLEEVRATRRETQSNVHRERYRILSEELSEIDLKRDDLAQQLKEIIEERGRLISAMSGEMNSYDQEQANRMATDYVGAERYWLNEEFGQWLR